MVCSFTVAQEEMKEVLWTDTMKNVTVTGCGGLTMTGHQAPFKMFYHSPPQQDRRGENKTESPPHGSI